MQTLEQRCRSLEGELHPLHENKRTLEATKNSLLAENAALKNEVVLFVQCVHNGGLV